MVVGVVAGLDFDGGFYFRFVPTFSVGAYVEMTLLTNERRKHRRTTGERSDLEDHSPPEIQAIRKAFCGQFMKTGELNWLLHQQLLAYAITQRPLENMDD